MDTQTLAMMTTTTTTTTVLIGSLAWSLVGNLTVTLIGLGPLFGMTGTTEPFHMSLSSTSMGHLVGSRIEDGE